MKQLDIKNQYIIRVQQQIQYSFRNILLLKQALTHRSYSSENYERLEFIGDSILNYSVAKMLFDKEPKLQEGVLSQLRSTLVNQDTLAEIALDIGVNNALFLGPGEVKTGGDKRPSILADAMEAIFAAVSLDSNFSTAERIIQNLYRSRVNSLHSYNQFKNPKSLLQEILQSQGLHLPRYECVEQRGDSPNQIFKVECRVDLEKGEVMEAAEGPSKKQAEQNAARRMIESLQNSNEKQGINFRV